MTTDTVVVPVRYLSSGDVLVATGDVVARVWTSISTPRGKRFVQMVGDPYTKTWNAGTRIKVRRTTLTQDERTAIASGHGE